MKSKTGTEILNKQWMWLAGFFPVSIFIIGLMTDFTFRDLEIQLHDTYFVFNSIKAIIYLTLSLWTVRNMYLLVEVMTTKYQILAIFVSFINPLLALFILILILLNIQEMIIFKDAYPQSDLTGQLIPVLVMAGIIALLTVIQVRALRKVWELLKH